MLDAWGGPHLGMAKFCRCRLCQADEDGHFEVDLNVGIPSSKMKECLEDLQKMKVMLKRRQAQPDAFIAESEDPSEWS